LLESLPPAAGRRLREHLGLLPDQAAPSEVAQTAAGASPGARNGGGDVAKPADGLPPSAGLASWQHECAVARLRVLQELDRLAAALGSRRAARAALVERARAGALPEDLQEAVGVANRKGGGLVARTVERWERARRSGEAAAGRDAAFRALAPQPPLREPAGPPLWASVLLKHWRRPQKPALAEVLEDVVAELAGSGTPAPSYSQARRYLASLPAVERERGRRGPRALKEIRPFVRRCTRDLRPGDVYISDGHTFDAEVLRPDGKGVQRAEVTSILDVKTRMVVGWSVAAAESTWAAADALRHAVEAHGVPAIYYADRGPGQDNAVLEEILARLGIARERSLPYNSQARGIVERFNRHLIAAARKLPSYIGATMDPEAKGKVHRRTRRDLREIGSSRLLMRWDTFLSFVEQTVERYNARPHSSLGRPPVSPDQAWQAWIDQGGQPTMLAPAEAADAFRPYEVRTARRGEVQVHGRRYFAAALEHRHGEEVRVGYDIRDASRVWVRDLEDRLLAVAELDANSCPYMPAARIEQAREQRAQGRLRRLDRRREEVVAELGGPATVVVDLNAGWTAEHEAKREAKREARCAELAAPAQAPEVPVLLGGDEDQWFHAALEIERREAAGEALPPDDAAWLAWARRQHWYEPRRRLAERRGVAWRATA